MALAEEYKRKIEANIKTLDYLEGTGVISTDRKHLAKEIFVFISSGGSGHKALAKLKQTIIRQVETYEVENQIMFLAVDTDKGELEEYETKGLFDSTEELILPYEGVHDSIKPEKILPQLKDWVHPDLWRSTGAEGVHSDQFGPDGAGANRQCGRVRLSQSATHGLLYTKLMHVQALLEKMNGVAEVKVFFLAGLSGGTGSGTILDLTFLTRHFMKKILGPVNYRRTTFSGYLFLPSACGRTHDQSEITRGNRNAYAALKEIDYYMTMTNREEHFRMDYGTNYANNVDITENVFDFCTLVEGVLYGGNFIPDNVDASRQIVADSILNIICADNAKTYDANEPGKTAFLVDSFLANVSQVSIASIQAKSDQLWPRDANYIYNVIGFSECVVPIDLLTVYITKKIYDKVYENFLRADDADEQRAVQFFHDCGLEFKELSGRKTCTKEQVLKDIQAQADEELKACGPFYMVNLTAKAAQLLEQSPEDYLQRAYKLQDSILGVTKKKGKRLEIFYKAAIEYLKKINKSLYEVYSYAIESLRECMERNAKLLTDTKEYQSHFGKTFCWSPIDLTPGKQATAAVEEYLNEIIDETQSRKKAQKFMDGLCSQREEWTNLAAKQGQVKFDAAHAIREYIKDNLKECVDTTLEEFLVKAYSGRKEAPVFVIDESNGREKCSSETKQAAREVLERLSNNADPLALTANFDLNDCISSAYLTLPDNCPWLNEAMENIANNYNIRNDNIFKSSARDRMVLCRLYAGVPAWALNWIAEAEEDYEAAHNEIGLHMDQGISGTNWDELPNLYPEKLWDMAQKKIRMREAGISQGIRENLERAKELCLLVANPSDSVYYDLTLLREDMSAETLYEAAGLNQTNEYKLREVLDILAGKGVMEIFKIEMVGMVMTTPEESRFSQEEKQAFRFDLACRTLRRFHKEYKMLEKTIKAVEGLSALIPKGQLALFIECLKWGLLVYDGRRGVWKLTVGNEKALGKCNEKFEKTYAHYYGYRLFEAQDDAAFDDIREGITCITDKATDEEYDAAKEQMEALKESLIEFKNAQNRKAKPWPQDSPFAEANGTAWPMASMDFEEEAGAKTGYIRSFYTNFIDNI